MAGLLLDGLGVLTAPGGVQREPESGGQLADLVVVVALVEAQSLRVGLRWGGPPDRNAVDRFSEELVVVPICAIDREAEGDARCVRQQAALGSVLGAVGWIWAGFFPRLAAPLSSRRPSPTTSSRSPSAGRTRGALDARTRGTRPRPPTRRTVGAPRSSCRCPWRSGRSMDSPSGARTESPPWHCGRALAGCGSPAGALAWAAAAAPSCPRGHREFSSGRPLKRGPYRRESLDSGGSASFRPFLSRPKNLTTRPTGIGSNPR